MAEPNNMPEVYLEKLLEASSEKKLAISFDGQVELCENATQRLDCLRRSVRRSIRQNERVDEDSIKEIFSITVAPDCFLLTDEMKLVESMADIKLQFSKSKIPIQENPDNLVVTTQRKKKFSFKAFSASWSKLQRFFGWTTHQPNISTTFIVEIQKKKLFGFELKKTSQGLIINRVKKNSPAYLKNIQEGTSVLEIWINEIDVSHLSMQKIRKHLAKTENCSLVLCG